MDISNDTIFIPGATSGIGLALATRLHDAGNTVIVGGRRQHLLDEIAAAHPGIDTVAIDTADPESIRTAAAEVIGRHPDLNVLVTMAGIMRQEDWHSADGFLADAEEVITTNVLGPIRLVAAFVEQLRSQPASTIITVSSGLAFVPLAATASYTASKGAIHMLSESIRIQLADTSVSVKELVPPEVVTDLMPGESGPYALPLDAFADEVMTLLRDEPDASEILVEGVKFLRNAPRDGSYEQVVAMLNPTGAQAH